MKIKTTAQQVVSLQEWDKCVRETYGRPYSFQQQEGCQSRGTYSLAVPDPHAEDYEATEIPEVVDHPTMGVSFASWLARDPKQPLHREDSFGLDLWWERNFYPHISAVANDLHAKGLLPAGHYLIDIDW